MSPIAFSRGKSAQRSFPSSLNSSKDRSVMTTMTSHAHVLEFQCAKTGEKFDVSLAPASTPNSLKFAAAHKRARRNLLSGWAPKRTASIQIPGESIDWRGFFCPNCGPSTKPSRWVRCGRCGTPTCTGASDQTTWRCCCGGKAPFAGMAVAETLASSKCEQPAALTDARQTSVSNSPQPYVPMLGYSPRLPKP